MEGLFEFLRILGVVDVLFRRRALSKCLFGGATAGKLEANRVDGDTLGLHGRAQCAGLSGGFTSRGSAIALVGRAAQGVLVQNAAIAVLGVVLTVRHEDCNLLKNRFALSVEMAQH